MKQQPTKEQSRDIEGYEGLYQITSLGRVWSIKRIKFLKCYTSKITKEKGGGYMRISLHKDTKVKTYLVARLVATAFIPNPKNKPQVNHIDGDKLNNQVENLEWCTMSENINHAYKNGLNKGPIGTKNRSNKLTPQDVKVIRATYKKELKNMAELARRFNITLQHVYQIIHRHNWKHI